MYSSFSVVFRSKSYLTNIILSSNVSPWGPSTQSAVSGLSVGLVSQGSHWPGWLWGPRQGGLCGGTPFRDCDTCLCGQPPQVLFPLLDPQCPARSVHVYIFFLDCACVGMCVYVLIVWVWQGRVGHACGMGWFF